MSEPTVFFVTGSDVVWGAERSLLTLAEGFSPTPVGLITSNDLLVQAWQERVGGPVVPVRAGGRLGRNRNFRRPLLDAVPAGSTLVLFDIYLIPLLVALRRRLARRGIAVVLDLHDSARSNPRRRPFFRLVRFLDAAVCVSEYVAQEIRPRRQRVVIHRPVEVAARPLIEPSPSGRPMVVGIVGQVAPHKNILAGIEAVAGAGHGAELVIRGDAPTGYEDYRDTVIRRGQELLGDRFRFQGRVPAAVVMDGLDILLMLNGDEPFGRVVAEAQFVGALCVVPDSGGSAELVEHGVTGFRADVQDTADLTATLTAVLGLSPTDAAGVRRAAREVAETRYQPGRQIRRYREAVQEAARCSLAGRG